MIRKRVQLNPGFQTMYNAKRSLGTVMHTDIGCKLTFTTRAPLYRQLETLTVHYLKKVVLSAKS